MPPPVIVQESTLDVCPQHNLCSFMQPMLIGDRGASRTTPFEGGGDDEDIPDKAKDPGGEAKDPGGEAGPQGDKARKKIQASGRGTTALIAVLPRQGRGTTVPNAVLPHHGNTVPTTATTTAGNRENTVVVTVVAAVLP